MISLQAVRMTWERKDEAFCITAEADLWHTFDAVAMKSQHINVIIITIDIG
jgi:hypothetical protein